MVEDLLHDLPEALLPLEDRLLRHYIRGHILLQATGEEDPRKVCHVIQRVIVDHDPTLLIIQRPSVNDDWRFVDHVLGKKGGDHTTFPDRFPSCTILASHRMPLKQHWILEAEVDTWNVDGVARYRDAFPTPAHCTIGRAPGFLQSQGFPLNLGRGDRGLLEYGTNTSARCHRILEHLVFRVVSRLTAQVEVDPLSCVHEGCHPLIDDQLHRVPGHLLSCNVHHRRRDKFCGKASRIPCMRCVQPEGTHVK
mmetsp:Transcript_36226/g.96248  ORF Transcript_36226/g.96248 Transcript_36226/m.96248 type:complete len:251 (-) Transcript_36226:45-797(-)